MPRVYPIALASLLALLLAGCGAPAKSAGDVSYLFDQPVKSIDEKIQTVCADLAARTEAPMTSTLGFDLKGCAGAGTAAIFFDDPNTKDFAFQGIDDANAAASDEIIRRTVRGQVWLKKSFLGFASAVSAKFKAGDPASGLSAPDSGKGLDNIVKTTITQLEPFKFDATKIELSALIHLHAEGAVKLDNDLRISGKLIDNAFAVTISSEKDQPVETSLIKSVSGLLILTPHATDYVYLDMWMDIQAHNLGLASLFRTQISGVLSDNLKKIIDTVLST